jgi:hypothetical protein
MVYSVCPQKNEAQEVIGYIRCVCKDGQYMTCKGEPADKADLLLSDDPVVVAFWAEKQKPPPAKPSLDDKIVALEARIAALEKT